MTDTNTPRVPEDELPAFLRFLVVNHVGHDIHCDPLACGLWGEFVHEIADTLERDAHQALAVKAVRAMFADDLTDEDAARVYAEFTQAGKPGFAPRPFMVVE